MATHDAVMIIAPGAPLEIRQVPTVTPKEGEVRVKVLYTASTPLDLHKADGGFFFNGPAVTGSGYAGVVVEKHASVTGLDVGDEVSGFGIPTPESAGHQLFVTIPAYACGKIPENYSLQEAVTLTGSVVTVFRAMTADLDLELPWPVPRGYVHPNANDTILVWGGSGSVGVFALQILRHLGFRCILSTASKKNHGYLSELGATNTFDYREADVMDQIRATAGPQGIKYVIDCIGHRDGSVRPIAQVAESGTTVAVVLPVIVKDAGKAEAPEYSIDATKDAEWEDGVVVKGIRAHFYTENPVLREKAQPEMVPSLLASGAIKPTGIRIVEGKTLLDRATAALDILRNKSASAERLVWRVADA